MTKQNRGNRRPGARPKHTSRAERQTAIWAAIRDNRGDWTTSDIADTTGAPRSTVVHYVTALARGGFVQRRAESVNTQAGALPAKWRTVKRPAEAPIETWETRTAREQST